MKISLLGAPGSGKGTQAKLLSEYYGIAHISTGDLFRRAISENTPLGKQIKKYMSTLVPDEIVIKLVEERISQDDCANGYILDGFPRTINQAQLFLKSNKLDHVIYLNVDKQEVVSRIKDRLTCPKCSSIYIRSTHKSTKCSKCNTELVVRDEDKFIDERIDTYNSQTYPLVEYFDKLGILIAINGKEMYDKDPIKSIDKTFDKIKQYIGKVND